METASLVFRRMTQSAAASSAPHSSLQPALPRPGARGPPPGHSSREDAEQRVCRISAPPHPLPRPGWGRAARPPTWADPIQPQLRSLSLPTPPTDVSTPGQQEDRVFWAPPESGWGDVGRSAGEGRGLGGPGSQGLGRAERGGRGALGGKRSREVSRSRGQCGMRQEPDRPASSRGNASWIPHGRPAPGWPLGTQAPDPSTQNPFLAQSSGAALPLRKPRDRWACLLPVTPTSLPLRSLPGRGADPPPDKGAHGPTLTWGVERSLR